MEWVETTGKTVDEAMDRALAHLGVHRDDAEVEVLEEPKAGLFGRVRGEARVRARVRPSGPRPKRSRRSGGERNDRPRAGARNERTPNEKKPERENRREGTKPAPRASAPRVEKSKKVPLKEDSMAEGISLAEQGTIAKEFLVGLLSSMDIKAEVLIKELDEETVELSVNADPPTELGILVGPRGTTLQALQEVTRTVVQSKSPGRTDRILVDVAQYRERRVAALGRFAQQVAQEVIETGEERALEPMSAADRKAVHDALSEKDGVATRSEGEDPRRFVVVSPA
ncbi:MAG: single-stranded nucleic acid binding domain protein [Acidimicrobiaceae bacterium]|nr:single-stranded nucleic acid binding domain protein [Acidimicrobiaceae bacterium]